MVAANKNTCSAGFTTLTIIYFKRHAGYIIHKSVLKDEHWEFFIMNQQLEMI